MPVATRPFESGIFEPVRCDWPTKDIRTIRGALCSARMGSGLQAQEKMGACGSGLRRTALRNGRWKT